MDHQKTGKESPWEWSESTWRGLVGQVRAGRPLRPDKWPGDAPCAIALSFDSDHESNELRDGGHSIGRLSWGQYGNRVGIPRIERLLNQYGVRSSFYVPAVVALLYPEEQRRLSGAGHEIGLHGWIHEINTALPGDVERELMFRAAETIESVTGVRPIGMRTPSWDFSPRTLKIAVELGLAYDSSLMADEDCYELLLNGAPSGVVELPVEWIRDDAVYFMMNRFQSLRPYTPPKDVFDIFLKELDYAISDGGIFQLTMHPHIISARSRIWILEEIIKHGKIRNAWFATHAEIVAYVKDQCPGAEGSG